MHGLVYGEGIKQLEPVDNNNHIIMDYSIHDAIEAGFNEVIFIIRKDIVEEFKKVIVNRITDICAKCNVTVDYAFQDINEIPGILPEGRTKPWGTGQAVHEFLVNGGKTCMAGFVLKNTLSDNGSVTRGICKMDSDNNLTEIIETKNIIKTEDGAAADDLVLDINSLVSMNMWGLTPDFLDILEEGFKEFFDKEVCQDPLKSEYLIPVFIGQLLEQGKMNVKVLRTDDTWYGMTYKEDVITVKERFSEMLESNLYSEELFNDISF